jgi:predicted nucleic acid-binding protein
MSYVFDSNILIYQLSATLSAQGEELLRTGLLHGGAYSVISRIEIMGSPQSPEELTKADQLLRGLREIPLNDSVAALAINIRQHRKVKIPDAIVAATAIHLVLPLVSRNIRDFSNIEGLSVINPFEDAPR